MATPHKPSSVDFERMSMAAVAAVPMQPSWYMESPAFQSDKPYVVRACLLMLERAWRSVPAGSLPSSMTVLAPLVGLTQEQITLHFHELTHGWELVDGRVVHVQMHAVARAIWASQAEALDLLAARSAVVPESPDEFALVAPEAAPASPLKGKRAVPASFGLTSDLRNWLVKELSVADEGDQDFLMTAFHDMCRSRAYKSADPAASFRNFCKNEPLWKLPSRRRQVPTGGNGAQGAGGTVFSRMSERFGNAGGATTARNMDAIDRVLAESSPRGG